MSGLFYCLSADSQKVVFFFFCDPELLVFLLCASLQVMEKEQVLPAKIGTRVHFSHATLLMQATKLVHLVYVCYK